MEWLDEQIADWRNDLEYDELEDNPENIQATLLKLTTRAIKKAIYRSGMDTGEVYVCGGGAYNSYLLEQLRWRLRKHQWTVQTTADLGLKPNMGRSHRLCLVGNAFLSATKWQFTCSDWGKR